MIKKGGKWFSTLSGAAIFVSCSSFQAYFNTYYNAKRLFYQAERQYQTEGFSPALRDIYNKVIEKNVVIIRYFPNTPFVDDALYMLGVSYLRLSDYERAQRRFQELLDLYPKSPLQHRALLGMAEVALESGNPILAQTILDTLHLRTPNERRYAQRLKMLIAHRQGDTRTFLSSLIMLAQDVPQEITPDILLDAIDVAIQGGYYAEAEVLLGIFRKRFSKTPRERLATLRFVDLLDAQGRTAQALEILNSMAVEERDTLWPAVMWRKARLVEEMGDTAQAVKLLEALSLKPTEEGQRAALLLGERALQKGKFRDAQTWLMRVESGPLESLKKRAQQLLNGLQRLEAIRQDTTLPRFQHQIRKAQIWAFDFRDKQHAWSLLHDLAQEYPYQTWPLSALYLGVLVAPDSTQKASLYAILTARDSTGLYTSRLVWP